MSTTVDKTRRTKGADTGSPARDVGQAKAKAAGGVIARDLKKAGGRRQEATGFILRGHQVRINDGLLYGGQVLDVIEQGDHFVICMPPFCRDGTQACFTIREVQPVAPGYGYMENIGASIERSRSLFAVACTYFAGSAIRQALDKRRKAIYMQSRIVQRCESDPGCTALALFKGGAS